MVGNSYSDVLHRSDSPSFIGSNTLTFGVQGGVRLSEYLNGYRLCADCGQTQTNLNTKSNRNTPRCGKCYLKKKAKQRLKEGVL